MLRQFALKSPVADLNGKAECAEMTAEFLQGVHERRKSQRVRVAEIAKALARSQAWDEVLQQFPTLIPAASPQVDTPTLEAQAAPLVKECAPEVRCAPIADVLEESAPKFACLPTVAAASEEQAPEVIGDKGDACAHGLCENDTVCSSEAAGFSDTIALQSPEPDDVSAPMSEMPDTKNDQESGDIDPEGALDGATLLKKEIAVSVNKPLPELPELPKRARRRSAPGPGECTRPKEPDDSTPALGSWQDAGLKQLAAENRELKQRTAQLESDYQRLQRSSILTTPNKFADTMSGKILAKQQEVVPFNLTFQNSFESHAVDKENHLPPPVEYSFPAEDISDCVKNSLWDQYEDVMRRLRHFAMKSSVAELDAKEQHAEITATFLVGVAERRKSQRARVMEVAKALARSQSWQTALQGFPSLMPAAPAALEPAVAPFHEEAVSAGDDTFSGKILKMKKGPPLEPPESAAANITVSVAEQMRVGVQTVLAIQSDKFDSQSVTAFVKLRQAALRASQLSNDAMQEILHAESGHANAVLAFLLDLVTSSPIRKNQAREVARIFLTCPAWQRAARSSPELLKRNTSPAVRELLEHISTTSEQASRRFATSESQMVRRATQCCIAS